MSQTLPYWDWENEVGNERDSRVFVRNLFGDKTTISPTTGCVTAGIAVGWDDGNAGGCVNRNFGTGYTYTSKVGEDGSLQQHLTTHFLLLLHFIIIIIIRIF